MKKKDESSFEIHKMYYNKLVVDDWYFNLNVISIIWNFKYTARGFTILFLSVVMKLGNNFWIS